MNPLVKKLEERLLPEFEEIAEKIRKEFSNVTANVESHEVGSATDFQGYSFQVSCLFTADLLSEEADNVALSVSLCHLTTIPKIEAYVCWGHPSGFVEAEFPDFAKDSQNNSLIVTEEVLEGLYKNLPQLYEALFTALRRRKPLDE